MGKTTTLAKVKKPGGFDVNSVLDQYDAQEPAAVSAPDPAAALAPPQEPAPSDPVSAPPPAAPAASKPKVDVPQSPGIPYELIVNDGIQGDDAYSNALRGMEKTYTEANGLAEIGPPPAPPQIPPIHEWVEQNFPAAAQEGAMISNAELQLIESHYSRFQAREIAKHNMKVKQWEQQRQVVSDLGKEKKRLDPEQAVMHALYAKAREMFPGDPEKQYRYVQNVKKNVDESEKENPGFLTNQIASTFMQGDGYANEGAVARIKNDPIRGYVTVNREIEEMKHALGQNKYEAMKKDIEAQKPTLLDVDKAYKEGFFRDPENIKLFLNDAEIKKLTVDGWFFDDRKKAEDLALFRMMDMVMSPEERAFLMALAQKGAEDLSIKAKEAGKDANSTRATSGAAGK